MFDYSNKDINKFAKDDVGDEDIEDDNEEQKDIDDLDLTLQSNN